MAEGTNEVIFKNVLAFRACEKLYLDRRTCDVYFVFKSLEGEVEKVPAHKSILSAVSEVFDAMFYGPSKQEGDINIVDSTPGAFKEFLQYFYLSTVKVTAENVDRVMNLGKQYMLNDCLNACTVYCQKTLVLDNICWGYELAILFEQDVLKNFCEQKIGENSKEIFQSNSFLNCDKNILRHILRLNSLNCDESVVFDGCIAWAKAACIQKGLNEVKMENLRIQLGDLFSEIRFGRMTLENFYARYQSYNGLFSSDEFKDIIGKISSKNFQPRTFNRSQCTNDDILICDRYNKFSTRQNRTTFRSNCLLILKSFIIYVSYIDGIPKKQNISANIRISEHYTETYSGNLLYFEKISINKGITNVELTSSIKIKPAVRYSIEIETNSNYRLVPNHELQSQKRMDQGAVIDFDGTGIVECLHFIQSK